MLNTHQNKAVDGTGVWGLAVVTSCGGVRMARNFLNVSQTFS